jgi:hypothetical protein
MVASVGIDYCKGRDINVAPGPELFIFAVKMLEP